MYLPVSLPSPGSTSIMTAPSTGKYAPEPKPMMNSATRYTETFGANAPTIAPIRISDDCVQHHPLADL